MVIRLDTKQITEGVAALARPRVVTRKGRQVELAPAVVVEEGRVSGRSAYHAEAETARHVRRLLAAVAGAEPLDVPEDVFGEGFEPDASQREAVELAAQSGVIVLTGGPGCIDASTPLLFETGGRVGSGGRWYTVESAYHKFHRIRRPGKGGAKFWTGAVRTLSMTSDGGVAYNVVRNIVYTGVKPVFEVKSANGRHLLVTADHPFKVAGAHAHADEEGYVRLQDLTVGDQVVVRRNETKTSGPSKRNKTYRRETHVPHHPKARTKFVTAPISRTDKTNTQTYEYKLVREARLVVEAALNGMTLQAFVAQLQTSAEGLKFVPSDLEIHHKNGDVSDNRLENLEALSKAEHARNHGQENRLHFGTQCTEVDTIESITPIGERPVYDLVMEDPHRNYVAGGFVVHNCGKTTVAKALLNLYESAGLTVLCAAPTGKAAQRLREQTGYEAATIHRLIGMVPGQPPRKNPSEPLECGVLVLDETSMVDVHLAAAVLAAVPTGARLLIIGDVDQLPSIGCGRVLHDLMASGEVPTARLTKIHRQASESRIPYVARDLNEGRCPDLSVTGTDVSHWETQAAGDIAERVVRAVVDAIPAHKGIPAEQVQVLAAQYDVDNPEGCGVYGLNLRLQAALNPAETDTDDIYAGRGYSVRRGDRVIHTRNNYDLHVMNGEIGRVIAHDVQGLPVEPFAGAEWAGKVEQVRGGGDADENPDYGDDVDGDSDPGAAPYGGVKIATVDGEERLVFVEPRVLAVQYEDRVVLYTRTEARELELAYAISVHRSQGSQFPAVIVVCPRQHGYMLTRALVYTAVTRAEKFCLLVGEEAQIASSARNTRGTERRTTLQDRLRQSS